MKKVLLSAAALLIASLSFGQAKWGIVAGPNFSSITAKNFTTNGKETSKLITGVRAGVTVDIPLAEEFFIGTGLLYAGKGGKDKDNTDFKTTLSYLQLPVNFMFKPEVGSGNMVLAVGPYFAYGVGGKYKGKIGSVNFDTNVFDDGVMKLKRFDAGAGIQIGYEMLTGLYFGLNADLGLVNNLDDTKSNNGDRSFKNTSFGVSLGYKFGGK
ncbi:porin family protein [Chitinophaga defluvii]|uniref:Porin family protein n=1 Tax=Chitinophaga defluvii TaxID=3163343 RepID=A0ABV2T9S4_9BACT